MSAIRTARWAEIDDLFEQALDRPPDEQTAFLRDRCGGDLALYRAVTDLLVSDAAAEVALGESATTFVANLLGESAAAETLAPDAHIGPYRIEGVLGRGGMGVVYRAARADGTFEKEVALKLVKRGMDTDEVLRRFRYERQILAGLDHPGIARLLDAGAAPDGRPYLVMERVAGEPITDFADRQRLPINERVTLFERVAEAVTYAHRRLVVHRDLKPSNVLVTDDGDVKLLDFGIARLLDEESDEATPMTRPEWRVLTPEYAAPEQLRGEPPTTATDVYALGVLFYELIVGFRPGADRQAPSASVSQEAALARASTPDRLSRLLRGDLDTIALAAIQPDPSRRYASAEALLEDIRRLRTGLPLRARLDTRRYRIRKFVERNRVGVAISAVMAVLLVVFVSVLVVQQRATARERDRVEQALTQREEIVVLLTDLLGEADPHTAQGDTLTVYELLARAETRVAESADYAPDVRAHLLHALGNVYVSMAEHDRAEPLLTDALALRRSLGAGARADLASTLELRGRLARDRGGMDEAVALHTEALEIRRSLRSDPHPALGQTLAELALSYQRQGDFESAEARFREAIDVLRPSADDADPRLAEALSSFAVLLFEVDELDEAEPLLREAIAMLRAHYGDRHPQYAAALSTLGSVVQYAGRPDEAEPIFLEALTVHTRAFGDGHPNVTLVQNNLATLYDDRGEHVLADSLYRRAIQSDSLRLGARHPDLAIAMHNHGLMLHEVGRFDAAIVRLREAYDILSEALGADHLHTIIFASSLGLVLGDAGGAAEGEAILREAIAGLEAQLGPDHWRVAIARRNLGVCLAVLGGYEEAEAHLRFSIDVLAATRGPDAPVTREAQRRLAALRARSQ